MATTKFFKVASQGSITTSPRMEEYKPQYSFREIFNITEEYTNIFDSVIKPSEKIKIRDLREKFHLKTIHPFWIPSIWTNLSVTTIGLALAAIYIFIFVRPTKRKADKRIRRCHEDI